MRQAFKPVLMTTNATVTPLRIAEPTARLPLTHRSTPTASEDRRQQGRSSSSARRAFARRALKSALGLAVIVGVGFGPVKGLLQTTSVEAVVNARIVSLRAPIDGVVGNDTDAIALGSIVEPGRQIFAVSNIRADRSRLDDLRRTIGRLEDERPSLVSRIAATGGAFADLEAKVATFRNGRLRELQAKTLEFTSNIAAAKARRVQAVDLLTRLEPLAKQRYVTMVELDQARSGAAVAIAAEEAAKHRLETLAVEREALAQGNFVGDSYNDRPSSMQKVDETRQRLSDLEAELASRDAQTMRLKEEAKIEAVRFTQLASAIVAAPTRGRIFEIVATPGEEVHRGQDLVRLINCSETVVTATVSESVYNKLRLGMPARVRLDNDAADRAGTIVSLTGIAVTGATMAIQPTALTKGTHRVGITVPGLEDAASCNIGRTGRVLFETSHDGSYPEVLSRDLT